MLCEVNKSARHIALYVCRTVATAWRGRSPQQESRGRRELGASLLAARCLHQPTATGATQVPPAPADSTNQSEYPISWV